MDTTFEISNAIYLVADGSEYDLHNDFVFVRHEYCPSENEARLSWRRSDGDWVPKDMPALLTLKFTGVSNLLVRKRAEDMPVSEDSCVANISFAPPDYAEDFDACLQGFRRADEHLSVTFQSGAAVKVWAEHGIHEIEKKPNQSPQPTRSMGG